MWFVAVSFMIGGKVSAYSLADRSDVSNSSEELQYIRQDWLLANSVQDLGDEYAEEEQHAPPSSAVNHRNGRQYWNVRQE